MKHTFAGLGASRVEVESLFMRDMARESFVTNIGRRTKYDYDMADGRFRWDDKYVYFDFYGQGKLRTIIISWMWVTAPETEEFSLVPSTESRWMAVRDEYAGAAHQHWPTSMWERAAWNTVNAWCTAHGTRAGVQQPTIVKLREVAAKSYARVTVDFTVFYFLPHPTGMLSTLPDNFYAASFSRHFPTYTTPAWQRVTNMTPEQRSYLAVAWDSYVEAGDKPVAPLMGMDDRGPTPHQLKYAMQKLARTVKRCSITPSMLRAGMKVELEHRNVTRGGIEKTARIAAAHMCERRDYYKRLAKYVER